MSAVSETPCWVKGCGDVEERGLAALRAGGKLWDLDGGADFPTFLMERQSSENERK